MPIEAAVNQQKRYDLKSTAQAIIEKYCAGHDTFGHLLFLNYRSNVQSGRFYV